MHNISTSDIQPTARRRCESEGKRGKPRPRPVSAVIYPTNRGRSDTEPSSPQALSRANSSSSTRNLSESDSSPRSKTPSVLNRLLQRRRSKEGNCSKLPAVTSLTSWTILCTIFLSESQNLDWYPFLDKN